MVVFVVLTFVTRMIDGALFASSIHAGLFERGAMQDEFLGAHGETLEVGLQRRGEVGVGERIAAGDETRDPASRGLVRCLVADLAPSDLALLNHEYLD